MRALTHFKMKEKLIQSYTSVAINDLYTSNVR